MNDDGSVKIEVFPNVVRKAQRGTNVVKNARSEAKQLGASLEPILPCNEHLSSVTCLLSNKVGSKLTPS